jgi:hypothetical protein
LSGSRSCAPGTVNRRRGTWRPPRRKSNEEWGRALAAVPPRCDPGRIEGSGVAQSQTLPDEAESILVQRDVLQSIVRRPAGFDSRALRQLPHTGRSRHSRRPPCTISSIRGVLGSCFRS